VSPEIHREVGEDSMSTAQIERSESISELAKALAKAQASIKGAVKDSQNPFFKSSYADLESVWDACRKPLTDNGLSVVQIPVGGAGGEQF